MQICLKYTWVNIQKNGIIILCERGELLEEILNDSPNISFCWFDYF